MQHRTGRQLIDGDDPPLAAKVAFLASHAAHPGAASVETRETHMAWVFLAGDRVLKMKKPVRYPFLDYGTLEARRRICHEEVRLNRRLAPDVYLGVARLTREPRGTLAIDGPGRTVEWLVAMRRLPDERMLDRMIVAGTVRRGAVAAVADRLAAFYRAALPADPTPAAHIARLRRELDISRELFSDRGFDPLSGRGLRMIGRLEDFLSRHQEIVMERVTEGRIVEGHGDLRPEHVCLTDPPVIIDCLEFSRELRLVDPFDELAYLGMECAVLGAEWIGPLLVRGCAAALRDQPADGLLAFYGANRASLRARQALAHLLESDPRGPEKWVPLAARYLDRAESAGLSLPPRGGRPASRHRADAG